jgi:hypothetical protein
LELHGVEEESLRGHRVNECRPPDHDDRGSGARHDATEVSADRPSAYDGNAGRRLRFIH